MLDQISGHCGPAKLTHKINHHRPLLLSDRGELFHILCSCCILSLVQSLHHRSPWPVPLIGYGFPWRSVMGGWRWKRGAGLEVNQRNVGLKICSSHEFPACMSTASQRILFAVRFPSTATFHPQVRGRQFPSLHQHLGSRAQVQPTAVSPRSQISSWSGPVAPSVSAKLPESMHVVELSLGDISHVYC